MHAVQAIARHTGHPIGWHGFCGGLVPVEQAARYNAEGAKVVARYLNNWMGGFAEFSPREVEE